MNSLVSPGLETAEISKIHTLPISAVYSVLNSRPQGLNQQEASQRLKQYGPNVITETRGKPLWVKFLANFTHLMAILLWMGGIVGFIAQMPQIGIAIWLVNIINGAFSFWQEFKAEKATEALRQLLPSYAHILRGEEMQRILAEELVPGDIMLLEEGNRISADARLVEENELRVDQSTLSGESHPVRKTKEAVLREDLTRPELPNLIFAGTTVAAGTGRAVVFATGMQTEFGQIAHLTQSVGEELSPLQKEMHRVTKVITVLATSIGVFFFFLGVLLAGVNLAESFIFSMGMIVAFVPEGMLPTVTLSLAMGVQRMARHNALIKRLSAVETLGCTTVICTDKTGTLTQNEMTVSGVYMPGHNFTISGVGYAPQGEFFLDDKSGSFSAYGEQPWQDDLRRLLAAAGLCNNARLVPPHGDTSHWSILGDPTEAALLVASRKGGLDLEAESLRTPRLWELPFDSRRKRMSTIHANNGALLVYVKGAPKEVLALCNRARQDQQDQPLSDSLSARIMAANDEYARNGLRVLAIAYRELPQPSTSDNASLEYTAEVIERDLVFLGLMAMMDPPRPEVVEAVEKAHTAGIRVIMITGDYGLTAESIAQRIGILKGPNPRQITGVDLDSLDDADLKDALKNDVIFARVAPEHKLRVVTALKEMGEIVAVTGDGVNDAPALKKADIGVAMGIAGTDVAKEAADMILTDDNFASIVYAIEEGRAVYANIRKFAMYVFNSNMAEAVPFVVFLFSRGLIPLPLTVMQVLAIDLGTDMVPAIGLGAEPPEEGVMKLPPRSQKEPLLNSRLLVKALLWYGVIESVASMSAYFFMNWVNGWPGVPLATDGTLVYRMATTMTLAGVVATQVGAVMGCRTDSTSVFRIGLFTNRLILWGILVELTLLAILIYTPFIQPIFNTAPIGLREWFFLFAWIPVIFFLDELRKAFLRWRANRTSLKANVAGGKAC
ncbi:MAG: cation-transporting P-type ATPase [Anaerolineales bacterium]|nr:cation-transporting P-type ATPase [Anaerolineales bacterium]